MAMFKHTEVLILALILGGCSPQASPDLREPDESKARISRTEAIRLARAAYKNGGMTIRAGDRADATFANMPPLMGDHGAPKRLVWLVTFVPVAPPPAVSNKPLPYVYIDDGTGKVILVRSSAPPLDIVPLN